MSNRLTPAISAKLADNVYELTRQPTFEDAVKILNRNYKGRLKFSQNDMLKGKTGGPGFLKVRTAFGFVLEGQGPLEGHAFVMFRGTQYLADWLTNLNAHAMGKRSACGQAVHAGFHNAFNSMLPQLKPFLQKLNNQHVHCIGHSLGGALATIAAEWIAVNTTSRPNLYTFGSPRVGLSGFSQQCTKIVGPQNIFRVYHKTDIVPCVPIWPYRHTPDNTGIEYKLYSPGFFPGAEWHDMRKYVTSVGKKPWASLEQMVEPPKTEQSILSWLYSNVIEGPTMKVLEWMQSAFQYVAEKCANLDLNLFNQSGSNFTFMDRLAYMLARGIEASKKLGGLVVALIKKIYQFLGKVRKVDLKKLNRANIRSAFQQLSDKVSAMAKQALNDVLADGRAI